MKAVKKTEQQAKTEVISWLIASSGAYDSQDLIPQLNRREVNIRPRPLLLEVFIRPGRMKVRREPGLMKTSRRRARGRIFTFK